MSLLVHTFVRDADGGQVLLEDPPYGESLAGFESTRTRLWGSAATRALGARFLPRLDGDDLTVEPDEIDDFLAECAALRPHLDRLAEDGGYEARYVTARFGNIVAAALRAKGEGGGILVW